MNLWQRFKSWVKKTFSRSNTAPRPSSTPRSNGAVVQSTTARRGSGGQRGYERSDASSVRRALIEQRRKEREEKKKKEERKQAYKVETFKSSTDSNKGASFANKIVEDSKKREAAQKRKEALAKLKAKKDSNSSSEPATDPILATAQAQSKHIKGVGDFLSGTEDTKEVARRMKEHPKIASVAEGIVRGGSGGAVPMWRGIVKRHGSKEQKAKANKNAETYEKNKDAKLEMAAELATSLPYFAGSSSGARVIGGKAIGKIAPDAAKKLARNKLIQKSAEKTVKKAVAKGATKAATKELVQDVALKKANKVIGQIGEDVAQDLTVGAMYDINRATEKYEVGSKEWWKEIGNSAAFNLIPTGIVGAGSAFTGNKALLKEAISDTEKAQSAAARKTLNKLVDKAAKKAKNTDLGDAVNIRNMAKPRVSLDEMASKAARKTGENGRVDVRDMANRNSAKNALDEMVARRGIKGELPKVKTKQAAEKISLRRKRRGDIVLPNEGRTVNAEEITEDIVKNLDEVAENTGKNADEITESVVKNLDEAAESAEKNAPKAEPPKRKMTAKEVERAELQKERDALFKEYEAAKAAGKRTSDILDEMGEIDLMIKDLDYEISEARKMAGKTPDASLSVSGEEAARSGERASGERTEFRRSNEETAREQARNRRTTNNRESVSQETFDRDFAAFEKKASENQAKIDAIKSRMRDVSPNEREALQRELDELRAEMRREYNRASMRYHPDRGGSDEWMGKFNNAFDDFRRGAYSGASNRGGFRSARSSTRARTASESGGARTATGNGGGGATPPPRSGASTSGEKGFKQPKGKASEGRTVNRPEDMVHRTKQKQGAGEKMKAAMNRIERELFDSLTPFEREARKKAKIAPDEMQKDYGAIDALRRFRAKAEQSIGGKQLNWMEDEVGKGLDEIYAGMDDATEEAFDTYLLLKHAPDRLREGTSIFKNVKLATGESLDDPEVIARETERLLKEHPEFADRAEDIYKYTRNELQNRVDAGLLSQETADKWIKDHPFYVPTHRDGFGEVRGIKGRRVGAEGEKAASGSDYDIRSIREQLAEATNRNWRDMSMNNLFRRMFGDKIGTDLAKEADGGLEKVLDNTITLKKTGDGGKYYARIWDNGEFKDVEIEKDFYDGLADLYKNGKLGVGLLDDMTEAVSGVTEVWKNLITEWSPIFMVKNAIRDFPEAVINSRNRKEFLHNFIPAIVDIAKGGPYSKALQRAGVSKSTIIGFDKDVTKLSKRGWLSRMNQATEMFPRLMEYMGTLEKASIDLKDPNALRNVSKELRDQAAANAADVTVNFQRNGSVGKALNKGFIPFFNPSLQGASKFVRNFAEADGAKAVLKTLLIGTALGAGPSTLSQFVNRDNPNYQRISARDRANNYIIAWPLGDRETDTFIKIPKSRFATVFDLPFVNVASDNKMKFAEFIKVGKDAIGIVDPTTNYIGSAFGTAMATPEGRTWYGTPIVPEALQDVAPSEQYDANTSWFGKMAGKATEGLPESMQISPKKADYIIDATTGIVGDVALPMTTPSRQGGGDSIIEKGAYALGNVPKRAFTIDSVSQNDLSTRFYDQMESLEHKKNSAKATQADAEEYNRINAFSKEAGKVNAAIKELQGSTKKTKQLDIRGLQKIRNDLMQRGLDGEDAPMPSKTMGAVQKYVGTTYAVNNFGSSADKEAMKVYGAAKYGDLSDEQMQKRIDSDKSFFKGVQAIGGVEDKLSAEGIKNGSTALAKAVALASVDADDELFGAYEGTKKSRTETATKMDRARNYLKGGGSVDEFVQLESARRNLGKLSNYDKESELDKISKDLSKGKINEAEYYQKRAEINYNANISYVGLATSLAQANAPSRGYELYDIKPKNIQKGINLAAMGFTARDYREMAKAVDADGNGYPKKQEIIDYVANSDVKDKATLYDALYYYNGSYNPFGTPTNYSRDQAAAVGKKNGINAISGESGDIDIKDTGGSSSGYGGYRRGYRRYGHRRRRGGGGSKAELPTPKLRNTAAYKVKTFKGSSYGTPTSKTTSLATRLKALQDTEAKIKPPTPKGARR